MTFLALFILVFLFTYPLFAQEPKDAPVKISLDIKGMDIVDVLKMLAQRSGMNIVVGKNVSGKVTLFLKNVSVQDAFEIILLANDLAYETKGQITNVITQRDYELQYGSRYQDKKEAKLVTLKYAKAIDLSRALNQIKSNIGRIVVDEGSNTLALIDTPDKIKEMEDFIHSSDLALETRVFSLNYAQAEKLSAKIQEAVTKSVGSLKIDERTNKIVVTDYPQKLDEIANIIAAFDEKTKQVLIDAQIVEISPQKDQFSMGVDWDYWLKKNVRLVGSMAAPTLTDISTIPNKLSIGVASRNVNVSEEGEYKSVVDILKVIGQTKILSSPRIMALNNQEAKILVGTKEAYITSATSQSGDNAITSQTVNFVDVGIKLYVTPTINRDGFVTMKIKPEISSSQRTNITSGGQVTQIPIVTTSESETVIMVKDGTTIIIAGLKKDNQSKETRKIPVLGDIPLLGHLFKNTKEDIVKSELVIFITPRIISGDEPLDYVSLTNDKDIISLQSLALQNKPKEDKFMTIQDYKKSIFDKISAYSASFGNKGVSSSGEVELSFILDASGDILDQPQIISSTNASLNQTAISCVRDSAPFAPFPQELKKEEEQFRIVLEYK
jgi:TonB family protein